MGQSKQGKYWEQPNAVHLARQGEGGGGVEREVPHLLPLGPSTERSLAQPVWVSALALSRCRVREPQAWLRSLDPASPPQSCRGLSLEVCGGTRSPTPELRALQLHHQHLGLQAGNPVAAATSWGAAVPPPRQGSGSN